MRIGWGFGAGPVRVGGTLWRSKKRRKSRGKSFHGTDYRGKKCQHNHSREDLARECARKANKRGGY